MTDFGSHFRLFLRLSRLPLLVASSGLYALGLAIVDYLGFPVIGEPAVVGWLVILLIQLMAHYLIAMQDWPSRRPVPPPEDTQETGSSPAPTLSKQVVLMAAIVSGGLAGLLLTAQGISAPPPPLAWLILALLFAIALTYALPPIRLRFSGYGEVITSLALCLLVPSYAFALQTGETHRLILISTTPLVGLFFALQLALQLESYASDQASQRRTLMIRLGWSTGMRLHDASLAAAALAYVLAFLQGVPWRTSLGALIVLPLLLFQIWQMGRVRAGHPPAWRLIRWNAIALFGLGIYLGLTGYVWS